MRTAALGQGAPACWQRFLVGMVATSYDIRGAARGSGELTPAANDADKVATYKVRTCATNQTSGQRDGGVRVQVRGQAARPYIREPSASALSTHRRSLITRHLLQLIIGTFQIRQPTS